MKLHFDSNQEYQIEAIRAITDLFEGQPLSSEDFEFFFKLPFWFRINTPIGDYNPDWAIVFRGEKKIYFVAETKSAGQEFRQSERIKIDCGKAHFNQFDDIKFIGPVSSVSELNR